MATTEQGFIEQDTALESMRASDFDCYSAYGEVVDNSIQANATKVWIEFTPKKSKVSEISKIHFIDNGTGMEKDTLHKCLKLGHSSRYNDRSGIGRFGVGMTLGAIHECRRVEVYSKAKGGLWYYTYLDLDEIKEGKLKFLPEPINQKPSERHMELVGDSGTIVTWLKYDKQITPLQKILNESHFWFGRTFRKFIWGTAKDYGTVEIRIDGKVVPAFDPLFVTKEKTGFGDEKKAELLKPQSLPWNVPIEANHSKQKSEIVINVSLLPDEYRRDSGQGGDSFAKERYINRNQGISILRNDREVFYGIVPHATALGSSEADIMVNRFIGCEIDFSAELDVEFAVKHIKRGAVPVKELKKKIESLLSPTFRTLRDKVRKRWEERKREATKDTEDGNAKINISGIHSDTNKLLRDKGVKQKIFDHDKAGKTSDDNRIIDIIAPEGSIEEKKNALDVLKSNGVTIDEREFFGSDFIDIEHGNGYKTLFYNTRSPFYKEYKSILDDIASTNSALAKEYRVLIDLIFVGYMMAESKIDPNESIDGATFMNELKSGWALDLARMLKKWKS